MEYIDIVFDGPPTHEPGRFVEVEDSGGRSINYGRWVRRENGYWALRIFADDKANRRHTHQAGTLIGKHIDECALCGADIRAPVHSVGETMKKFDDLVAALRLAQPDGPVEKKD